MGRADLDQRADGDGWIWRLWREASHAVAGLEARAHLGLPEHAVHHRVGAERVAIILARPARKPALADRERKRTVGGTAGQSGPREGVWRFILALIAAARGGVAARATQREEVEACDQHVGASSQRPAGWRELVQDDRRVEGEDVEEVGGSEVAVVEGDAEGDLRPLRGRHAGH
eukprot:1593435-Rhodomonas_salina.1